MLEAFVGVLGTACIGLFAWAVQLGNRVSVIEAKDEDLRTLINEKFADVSRRLDRIERAMNGALKGH